MPSLSREVVLAQDAHPPLPIYSQGIISQGKHVFLSGNLGFTKDMKIVEGGVQPQTVSTTSPNFHRDRFSSVQKILKAAGSSLENVVKVNIYLTDLARDFVPMNEVYKQFFPTDPPARTCIGVAALPMGGDVEIELVALVPE